MQNVKVGIIGMGAQGSFYADMVSQGKVKGMELGALCSRSESKKEYFTKKYNEIPFFTTAYDLCKSKLIDAVIVCTPHYAHPDVAKIALENELHVLVDKPAGVEAKKVQEVNKIAEKKKHLSYAIIYNQRTNPLYQALKQIIDTKQVGEIRNVNWLNTVNWRPNVYYNQNKWRATWAGEGGGVLINQAAHQIDILQWIFGVPKQLYAKLKTGYQRNISVEDDATLLFEYANGATGIFVARTHDLLGTDRLEILGDKGKILIENNENIIIRKLHKSEKEINLETKSEDITKIVQSNNVSSLYEEEILSFTDEWGEQHIEVLENFVNNILYKEPLIAPGIEGINSVQILNAAYVASWVEQSVNIPVEETIFGDMLENRITQEKQGEI